MKHAVVALYLALCAAPLILAYSTPAVKLLRGSHVAKFTLAFDLAAALLRREALSTFEFVSLAVATLCSLALTGTWILLRVDPDYVHSALASSLSMTRTTYRRDRSVYVFWIGHHELTIQVRVPLPSVAVFVFGGNWRYTKARVLRQLVGKHFKPVIPRYVIRLGGHDAKGGSNPGGQRPA